jgi:DNA recombination protein RmuC
MNEWLIGQGISSPQTGLIVGLLVGLLFAVILAWIASRRTALSVATGLQTEIDELCDRLELAGRELASAAQENAVLETRAADREQHFIDQVRKLEQAEQRLSENFERLAGRIFEQRSEKLSDLNQRQLDALLKPLGEKLTEFRATVENAHVQETAQHEVLKEKMGEMEKLNQRLHDDATNLSRALTGGNRMQGSWGEQQLERLLELAGLQKGVEYSSQPSFTTDSGQRLQPDLVMQLTEEKSIVLDSKVSLAAWAKYQSCIDEKQQSLALKEHTRSLRRHVKGLSEKGYADIPQLNSLDFVLMFIPIENALITALEADQELSEFALRHKVVMLSPGNFLATMRTVASLWSLHKQNSNAQEIARRAGFLYDKFAGFVENLQGVGNRLRQAQQSFDEAFAQLSTGAGNLVRQSEQLRELGARNTKHLERRLGDASGDD